MLDAKIFDGKSIRDRWKHLIIEEIGGLGINDWLVFYGNKLQTRKRISQSIRKGT